MPSASTAGVSPHYGWYVVALTLVMQASSVGVLVYCFALFAVPWIDVFAAPRRDVMLAITLLQIGTGVTSVFAGRLMERVSLRLLVVVGALVLAAGLGLASQATALWQLIVLYALVLPVGNVLCGAIIEHSATD